MSNMNTTTTTTVAEAETKVIAMKETKEDKTPITATIAPVEAAPVVEAPKKASAKKAKKETAQKTKKEIAKKETTKKETTKKEVAQKDASKKTTTKKVAKEVAPNVFFQFLGNELDVNAINAQIKEDWVNNGNDIHAIETLDVYIKPEEATAYYVVNKEDTGKILL